MTSFAVTFEIGKLEEKVVGVGYARPGMTYLFPFRRRRNLLRFCGRRVGRVGFSCVGILQNAQEAQQTCLILKIFESTEEECCSSEKCVLRVDTRRKTCLSPIPSRKPTPCPKADRFNSHCQEHRFNSRPFRGKVGWGREYSPGWRAPRKDRPGLLPSYRICGAKG